MLNLRVGACAAIVAVAALTGCSNAGGDKVAVGNNKNAPAKLNASRAYPSCVDPASFVDDCSGFPRYNGPGR